MMALSGIVAIIPYIAAEPSPANFLFSRLTHVINHQRSVTFKGENRKRITENIDVHSLDRLGEVSNELSRSVLVGVSRHDAAVEAMRTALAFHFPPSSDNSVCFPFAMPRRIVEKHAGVNRVTYPFVSIASATAKMFTAASSLINANPVMFDSATRRKPGMACLYHHGVHAKRAIIKLHCRWPVFSKNEP